MQLQSGAASGSRSDCSTLNLEKRWIESCRSAGGITYSYVDKLKRVCENTGLFALAGAVWEGPFVLHVSL